MLKRKDFWIGFLLGYALVAFVPAANVVGKMKGQAAG
jgi:hypothetical protein